VKFWRWLLSLLHSMFGTGPDPKLVKAVRSEPPVILPGEARLVTVKPQSGAPDIRHFDAKAINDAIERNVSVLSPGKSNALLVFGDYKNGKLRGNAVLVGRLKKPILGGNVQWTVYATKEWGGDVEAGAGFKWES
jgi:hypothetical protein